MRRTRDIALILGFALFVGVSFSGSSPIESRDGGQKAVGQEAGGREGAELATLGAGCFWCVEAVFQRIDGVVSVVPGYAGGESENPTYDEVCRGSTGHAEVAQIAFDPVKVSFEKILDVFWHSHDPTTLNRQGADIGTQYRSAIFTHDDGQREIAEQSKAAAEASGLFNDPIMTEITPLEKFYAAESYHQDYYDRNPNAPYCRVVIAPKLKKLGLD